MPRRLFGGALALAVVLLGSCATFVALPPSVPTHRAAAGGVGRTQDFSSTLETRGFSNGLLALGLAFGFAFAFSRPVMAVDIENGAGVFAANCAACHAGGNNA
eukprot:CAMPEP_0197633878 /NCGR_PEP_ID=MMETSP1338-20131121/10139_1 /TAXON_ID=43686 ORGANISM="Pelagodinium beii, Strain RCC1491" /NCGR_SAMPLE_ID=MMETSP1338 /ASSEMBLY_ACC=CAM_ASM_000754 /LENGTH=102 /DNA_ID=CAMNT_0043205637 /DNA_START=25 /DNA_END=329 /DNA_ORIENTATION=-